MKKAWAGILGLGLLVLPGTAFASSFDAFQQQQRQAFQAFQQDFDSRFQAYRQAFDEALSAYQDELSALWSDPQLTSAHIWVDYSQDQTSRSRVDFAANQMTLEVDAEAAGGQAANAVELLLEVLERPLDEALQRDEVTQRAIRQAGLINKPLGAQGQQRVLSEIQPEQAEAMLEQAEISRHQERPAKGPARDVIRLTVPLPASRTTDKAREFMPLVQDYAQRYDLEPALLLAIMHSESSFNPMARSHIPAFGLMQIVPGTAGRDVAQVVYGDDRLFSPAYLYDPENNVRAGAVYLDLLERRYLRQIEHPESRLYAVIAAYNTGAGNVARAFTGGAANPSRAAVQINRLQPDEVYQHLKEHLPYQETRNYLSYVSQRLLAYRDFN